jgi:hypothetical protein
VDEPKKFRLFHGRRIADIIVEIEEWLQREELQPTNESIAASFTNAVFISVIVTARTGGYSPLIRYHGSQGNIDKINQFLEQEISDNDTRTVLRTKTANAGWDHVVLVRYLQAPIPLGTNAPARDLSSDSEPEEVASVDA